MLPDPSPRPLEGDGERRLVLGMSPPLRVFLLCAAAAVNEVEVVIVEIAVDERSAFWTCLPPQRGTGSCKGDTATAAYPFHLFGGRRRGR